MNIIQKQIFYILLAITLICSNCQSKKQDRDALTSLIINNLSTNGSDKNKSLIQLDVADLGGSYTGKCFDTFQLNGGNVTPTAYYNTPAGGAGGLLNNNVRKYAVSISNCSELGFTSGTNFGAQSQRPNPNDNFTFRMYTCDPNNNPCTKSAITAAGF